MNYKETIGFDPDYQPGGEEDRRLREYINLKLAARGFPVVGNRDDFPFLKMGESLIANFQEKTRLLADHLCPVDQRIHDFLEDYLGPDLDGVFEEGEALVPAGALVLERHGLIRILLIPATADSFKSSIVSSFKVKQGVCHNPASDRRPLPMLRVRNSSAKFFISDPFIRLLERSINQCVRSLRMPRHLHDP